MKVTPGLRCCLAWVTLAVAVVIGFGWTLQADFLGDDFGYVQRFWQLDLRSWPQLFVREWSGGIWGLPLRELRPIAALIFLVDARLWAGWPAGYHATNLLLHLVCSGMVMLAAREVFARGWLPGVAAGLLFALHPVHTEAVAWITGRVDMLGTLGFLCAFYALLRLRATSNPWWLAAAWVAFACGIFAKEFCLTLPFFAIVFELIWMDRGRRPPLVTLLAPYGGWALIMVVYYICRTQALGPNLGAPSIDYAGQAFRHAVAQRELIYLSYMVWPLADWLPLADAERVEASRAFVPILAAVILSTGIWWWRDRSRGAREARAAVAFGVMWWLFETLPFIVTYTSARHLYLASAGICVGVVAVLTRFAGSRPAFAGVSVLLVMASAMETRTASAVWRDASRLSAGISREVRAVAARATRGEVLLLDVPATLAGSWVWSWASPFALAPPFQPRDIADDLIVLEREAVYFNPERWMAHPSIPRLEHYKGRVWVVSTADDRAITIEVPRDRAGAALSRPHVLLGSSGSFQRLVDALIGPSAS